MENKNFDTEELISGPGGEYLINKLGINNTHDLAKTEYRISAKRLYELLLNPVDALTKINDKYHVINEAGSLVFDENLFLAINYYLLSDIYYFAGEYKHQMTYAKGRGNASFNYFAMFNQLDAVPSNLHYALVGMNNELANKEVPNKEYIATKLASYFLTIVNIHPFREGNGRTLRAYFSLFMEYNMNNSYKSLDSSFMLDWSKVDNDVFQNVMYENQKDSSILTTEFLKALVPISKEAKLRTY